MQTEPLNLCIGEHTTNIHQYTHTHTLTQALLGETKFSKLEREIENQNQNFIDGEEQAQEVRE